MPFSPGAEIEEVIFETSSDLELESPVLQKPQAKQASQSRKRKKEPKSDPKNEKTSAARRRGEAATQLSPPPTLVSSRNTSRNTTAGERDDGVGVAVGNTGNGATQIVEVPRSSDVRKGVAVTKRKPKRPLVSFC